jgi:hypothetical protein
MLRIRPRRIATLADGFPSLACHEVVQGVLPKVQSPGTLPLEAECLLSPQCESLYCDRYSSCQPAPPTALQISCQADPASCPTDMACVAGACTPMSRGGEPCDDSLELFCAEGFACGVTDLCESALGGPQCLCEPGGAEAGTGGIPVCTSCPYWSTCSGAPGITGSPTCNPMPLLGDPCIEGNMFRDCPSALDCVNDVCEVPLPPWEAMP